MPGSHCSLYGCTKSRTTEGLAFFRIPTKDDKYSTEWRDKLIDIITRDREVDANLRRQIKNRTLHICELHYTESQLSRRKEH